MGRSVLDLIPLKNPRQTSSDPFLLHITVSLTRGG
jgi:hypothetical protein